jgi:hypothetical protein
MMEAIMLKGLTLIWIAVFLFFSAVLLPGLGRKETAPEKLDADLPLSSVVLYSTGVGYFQRSGQVEGNASVALQFKTKDINDLLKSMTVQDFGGGNVTSVNYSPRDPLNQTLKTLAVNLKANPGVSGILSQIRGQEVSAAFGSQIKKSGVIIGIEQKSDPENRTAPYLNLLTSAGIQSFLLNDITSISLRDPKLQMELELALALLDENRRTDEKRVTFQFQGKGERRVQIGYLLETPVWKTTYRLVLGEESTHFLQGWAIVENSTDEDWQDVQMSLVSGRPISFKMDLYQPIYVTRPTVALRLAPSVRPQTHEAERRTVAPTTSMELSAVPGASISDFNAEMLSMNEYEKELDLSRGVESAAQGGQVGAFFRYSIEHPVTLPRQESAMVPIVNQEIEGERFGIYNSGAHAIHPFNAVNLENSTELYLLAGPITVFEAGTYAGDAELVSLPPGARRLISFSLDLDTQVEVNSTSLPAKLVGSHISRSILFVSNLYHLETSYRVRSGGEWERRILVEHPIRSDWKLVQPQEPENQTFSYYRLLVELKPASGQEESEENLLVAEEREVEQQVSLLSISDTQIQSYLDTSEISQSVKGALRGILERRSELNDTVRWKNDQEQKRNQIHREQERIRKNMARLEKESDLYQRYIRILDEQEDQLADITRIIEELTSKERDLRQRLSEYIQSLQVE